MRKIKNIGYFFVAAIMGLTATSCEDNLMEWEEQDPEKQITEAEIPLDMEEKIERYEALNTYANFPLGVGVGAQLYLEDEVVDSVIHQNFDEVVAGYIMKHAAMVNSDGSLDFTTADAFVGKAKENGLNVFGHTLVWHQNQNASYLNSLIAPEVIPGPAGDNLLSNGDFESNIDGWSSWGGAKEVVEWTTEDAVAGDGSMKAVTNGSASNIWDLEIQSGDIPVIEGHRYEITFFIKSDSPGQVRLAFNNMNQEYPWVNGNETIATNSTWQQVTYNAESLGEALMPATGATTMNFRFDVGADPNVTYYIDKVVVVDLDAEPSINNIISNGDFENGTLNPWGGWGNESTREVSAEGEGYGGSGYAMVLTNPTAADLWSAQQVYGFDAPLEQGVEYTCTFMVKASTEANIQFQLQSEDYSADYSGSINVGTSWTQVERTITPSSADRINFVIDFGEVAATYYFDDIVFGKTPQSSANAPKREVAKAPTYIEKTEEEKTQIITDAMDDFISQMVGHYKDDIHAWDVVNEPMNEDGTVRTGDVSDPADDEFYWQKYMGKDYAVMAFNMARQYGNADDTLFINDYNLEYSIPKCEGLIDYVEYIESQGAQVDGIGTQMHININTSKENIETMFQLLASTGKLIKVSELDVQVQTDAPSEENFEQQAEMYRFVVEAYQEHIPAEQQFGITVWGVSDAPQEHENWLPDDAPCLWDADYQRKIAYKYFADGLAGRDVSEDFSGELQD